MESPYITAFVELASWLTVSLGMFYKIVINWLPVDQLCKYIPNGIYQKV